MDEDAAMMRMVPQRLGAQARRVELVEGNFEQAALPECDAIVASYALHHIREQRRKQEFYRRCFRALRPGGMLINADCAPAVAARAFARDLETWYAHLAQSYGRAKGKRIYASWASEDFYFPLATETRMLERAGFLVEVPWRRSPFAVIAAIKF